MLLEKTIEDIMKKNRMVIGFDFDDEFSQISFCRVNQSVPDTLSLVAGQEAYQIPTMVCCKQPEGATQEHSAVWSIGRDAQEAQQKKEGNCVVRLLQLVRTKEKVTVGNRTYATQEILEIFIRKCLLLVMPSGKLDEIAAISFTLKETDTEIMDILRKAVLHVCGKQAESYFMSRQDCFFQYMIHQPEEMWIHDVLMYDFGKEEVVCYYMHMNRRSRPVATFIETKPCTEIKMTEMSGVLDVQKKQIYEQMDTAFLQMNETFCDGKHITSVFLLGESFSKEWCKESLRFLCRGRRVFQGNNLFSKGACYGARERVMPSTLTQGFIYLSKEKLKANIGMICNKAQDEVYVPLLSAGMNWYEVHKEIDFILVKDNKLELTITPLNGAAPKLAEITLEGFEVRGNRTNRITMFMNMLDADTISMEIRDKGFGDFFPSTGQVWREELFLGSMDVS